ncbi:MAG: hypothetical protein U9Q30_02255 [Campylobacterota bacterium]|nr:hypothetical protein [Campylobacterota bacterium]
MARLVGIQNSTFDAEKFKATFSENHGEDKITTEDIQKGWKNLKKDISDDMFDELKQSKYYIQSTNNNDKS